MVRITASTSLALNLIFLLFIEQVISFFFDLFWTSLFRFALIPCVTWDFFWFDVRFFFFFFFFVSQKKKYWKQNTNNKHEFFINVLLSHQNCKNSELSDTKRYQKKLYFILLYKNQNYSKMFKNLKVRKFDIYYRIFCRDVSRGFSKLVYWFVHKIWCPKKCLNFFSSLYY